MEYVEKPPTPENVSPGVGVDNHKIKRIENKGRICRKSNDDFLVRV